MSDRDREFNECIDEIAAAAQSAPACAKQLVAMASVVTDARELVAHCDGNSGRDEIEAMGILVMRMADIAVMMSAPTPTPAPPGPAPTRPDPAPTDPDPDLEAELQRICDRVQLAIERGHVKLTRALRGLAEMTAALDAYGINMVGGDVQLFERGARMEFVPILDDLIDEIERGEAGGRN